MLNDIVLCSGEGTSIFAQLKCFPAVIVQYLCVGGFYNVSH